MSTYFWHNFRTGEVDELTETPTDFSDYVPRIEAAQALYKLYQEIGETPQEAFIRVMEQVTGTAKPQQEAHA